MENLFIYPYCILEVVNMDIPVNEGPLTCSHVPLIPYTQPLLIFRYFVLFHCICTFLF